jgi:hypothetical protein
MDETTVIDITPLNTRALPGHHRSTLTITRRAWNDTERKELARILFGPRPGESEAA